MKDKHIKFKLLLKLLFTMITLFFLLEIILFSCYVNSETKKLLKNKNLFFRTLKLNSICCVFDVFVGIDNEKIDKVLICGDKTFVYSEYNEELISNANYIQGTFEKSNKELRDVISKYNFRCIYSECFNNYKVFYLYSQFIEDFKLLDFKKVNLQIVFKDSEIIVGVPMVYGAY